MPKTVSHEFLNNFPSISENNFRKRKDFLFTIIDFSPSNPLFILAIYLTK